MIKEKIEKADQEEEIQIVLILEDRNHLLKEKKVMSIRE